MRRVEFLGGGERYKLELADHNEPPFEAVGLARNPIGLVGSQQERVRIRLRLKLKQSKS